MQVQLARQYRWLMLKLLPTTLGVGTVTLWARALNWPRSVDADGLALRYGRRIPWSSVKEIAVRRSYLDGKTVRLDIRHKRGISRIPVHAIENGSAVADRICSLFRDRARARRY
jgi:hypothetical protein